MKWDFEAADAGAARFSRRAFVALLRESCTASSDIIGAEVVFSELVANVVRHAPGPIRVVVETLGGSVWLSVSDHGKAFSLAPALPPVGEFSDGGRGLFIVSHLCASVSVQRTTTGNLVTALLPVEALSNETPSEASAQKG